MISKELTECERQVLPDHDVVVFAKDQPQYEPLPAVRLHGPCGMVLTRWELTDQERAAIALGMDVYLALYTFDQPLQPIRLTVGLPLISPAEV